jgi:hypothetical protein
MEKKSKQKGGFYSTRKYQTLSLKHKCKTGKYCHTRKNKKIKPHKKKPHPLFSYKKRKSGGCGCNAMQQGGNGDIIPINKFYPLSDITNDPNNPSNVQSERLLGGGKKRKQKGGLGMDSDILLGNGKNMTIPSAFATSAGASTMADNVIRSVSPSYQDMSNFLAK